MDGRRRAAGLARDKNVLREMELVAKRNYPRRDADNRSSEFTTGDPVIELSWVTSIVGRIGEAGAQETSFWTTSGLLFFAIKFELGLSFAHSMVANSAQGGLFLLAGGDSDPRFRIAALQFLRYSGMGYQGLPFPNAIRHLRNTDVPLQRFAFPYTAPYFRRSAYPINA